MPETKAKRSPLHRVVLYQLTQANVDMIGLMRGREIASDKRSGMSLLRPDYGNPNTFGQIVCGVVVADWGTHVNIKLWLDGPDDLWLRSVQEGKGPGQWYWTE